MQIGEWRHVTLNGGRTLLVGLVLLIPLCAILVSDGLFTIDEFVLAASARAIAVGDGLVFHNGYEHFGSDSLKLWLFSVGPGGLVAQYPVGTSYVGATLWGLAGVRGMIIVNAMAAGATLFVVYGLARSMLGDARVGLMAALLLGLGSFWLEYAFGVWPHSISVFLITLSIWCVVSALDQDARRSFHLALLAGFCIGGAMLFRIDSILAAPPLAAAIYIFSVNPVRTLVGCILGGLPGVVALSVSNYYKFGTFNPLSYGKDGGNTELGNHAAALVVLITVAVIVVLARHIDWRRIRGGWQLSTATIILVVVASVPTLREFVVKYAYGAWVLFVDAGAVTDTRAGVMRRPDGVLYFWGFVKKALGQSLPWAGLLLLWLGGDRSAKQNRMLVVVALFSFLWSFPFVVTAWHGGLGSNMRYLLPILPLLAVACAGGWFRLAERVGIRGRDLFVGVIAGISLILIWAWCTPSGMAGAQQIMSTWLLAAVCFSAIAVGAAGRLGGTWLSRQAQVVGVLAISVSITFGLLDLYSSQRQRASNKRTSEMLAAIPEPSLIYGAPELLTFQLERPQGLIALTPSTDSNEFDLELARAAIGQGYKVYAPAQSSAAIAQLVPDLAAGPDFYPAPNGGMLEISLKGGGGIK